MSDAQKLAWAQAGVQAVTTMIPLITATIAELRRNSSVSREDLDALSASAHAAVDNLRAVSS